MVTVRVSVANVKSLSSVSCPEPVEKTTLPAVRSSAIRVPAVKLKFPISKLEAAPSIITLFWAADVVKVPALTFRVLPAPTVISVLSIVPLSISTLVRFSLLTFKAPPKVVAVKVVKTPVLAELAPIVTPSIAPLSTFIFVWWGLGRID